MVILFTGLRESEAIGLTWDCVDFEAGVLKINKQLIKRKQDDGGPMLASTKNGKVRTIKPAPFVIKLLKRQHTEQTMCKVKLLNLVNVHVGSVRALCFSRAVRACGNTYYTSSRAGAHCSA